MAKLLPVQHFAKMPNEYVSIEIERSRPLSTTEERMLLMLINEIQKRHEGTKKTKHYDFDWIISGVVPMDEFRQLMDIGEKNTKTLREALVNLASYVIEFSTIRSIIIRTVFKEFIIDQETGMIKYTFNERFAEMIIHTQSNFFKLSIAEVIGFSSIYALKMYQLVTYSPR